MVHIELGKSREELKRDSVPANVSGFVSRMACGLSLALLLALGASAQSQDQQQQQDPQQGAQQSQDQQQSQAQADPNGQQPGDGPAPAPPPPPASAPQDQTQGQTPDQAPPPPPAKKPKYAPQDANRPPYANDYPSPQAGAPGHAPSPDQYDPDQDLPPGEQGAPDSNNPANGTPGTNHAPANRPYNNNGYGRPQNAPYSRNAAPATPPPATLTIPAGTVLSVRINEYLSSDKNQVGDRVTATLQQPVVVNGYVVARRGQMLVGQVEAAQKAGRVSGTSQLGIELTDLTVADGQSRPILTELWKGSGGTSRGADAATIGGTTALGAAIGSIADWGRGAAIG
ncbi:MAG: hypothetical protein JO119_10960, partial [Acidobacteria bacterium]|nr:hypothetical protein [Acidobacteriota bacterium]